MKLQIEAMTCGGCARSVAKAVQSVDPRAEVTTDVPLRLVDIRSTKPADEIAAALAKAGFPASPTADQTSPQGA